MAIAQNTIINRPEIDGSGVDPKNSNDAAKSKSIGKNRAAEIDSLIFIPKGSYFYVFTFLCQIIQYQRF